MDIKLSTTEFKASCLSVLDQVAKSKRPVTITRHGQPFARLVPIETANVALNPLNGSVLWEKDIVGPFHEEWTAPQVTATSSGTSGGSRR